MPEIVEAEQAGAQGIVDVVIDVGDVVGDGRCLRLEAGEANILGSSTRRIPPTQLKIEPRVRQFLCHI